MLRKLDKQQRVVIGLDFLVYSKVTPGEVALYKIANSAVIAIRKQNEEDIDTNKYEFLKYMKVDPKYRITIPKDVCEYVFGDKSPEVVNVLAKHGEVWLSLT